MTSYEKTIIIESNRQSAINEERDNDKDTGLFDSGEDGNTSNNRWETHIPEGLQLDIGDTINLEASMINSRGGGDQVIEYTGLSGKETGEGQLLTDNQTTFKFSFYVTNNQQFNFNLPKQRHQTSYDFKNIRYGSYANEYKPFGVATVIGTLNNQHFYTWEKSYPYQMPEGCLVNLKKNNQISLGYEYETLPMAVDNQFYNQYLPSISTGSKRTFSPNEKRFYIGIRQFGGPHYIAVENEPIPGTLKTYNYHFSRPWDYLTRDVDLNVEKGFINPSSLGAQLTEQLHERDGEADNWEEVLEKPFNFDIGDLSQHNPSRIIPLNALGVSDKSNIILPSCVGKPWYRNTNFNILDDTDYPENINDDDIKSANSGNWSCKFFQHSNPTTFNQTQIGHNYLLNQGDATYYSYIMTARPEYYKAVTKLLINMETRPASHSIDLGPITNYTLYTGQRSISSPGGNIPTVLTSQRFPPATNTEGGGPIYEAGVMGNAIVLQDKLRETNQLVIRLTRNNVTTPSGEIIDGFIQNQNIPEILCWTPEKGDFIVTNIIVNSITKGILEEVFRDYFLVYGDSNTVNPDSKQYRDSLAIQLNFGRIDDQQSEYYDSDNNGKFNPRDGNFKEVNLPTPYWSFFKEAGFPAPSQYQFAGFQFEQKIDEQIKVPAEPNTFNNTEYDTRENPSLPGTGLGLEGEFYVDYYLPINYTPEMAYNGNIPNPFDDSRFQVEPNDQLKKEYSLERYINEIWNNIPTDNNGLKLAFLPVCWKQSGTNEGADYWFGATGYKMFFFSFIYKTRIPPNFALSITHEDYNKEFPQPLPAPGEYVGLSPSELTCDLSQLCNTQKNNQTIQYPPEIHNNDEPTQEGLFYVVPKNYTPYLFVGSNDPLIKFDESVGKFSISQFHTPLKSGNGTFQIPSIPPSPEPNINQIASHFNRGMICKQFRNGYYKQNGDGVNIILFNDLVSEQNSLINCQSGIAINNINIKSTNNSLININVESNKYLFDNSLFNKMGFTLEQLLPYFGTSQGQFNRANYNSELGFQDGIDLNKKYNNMVKPFTTNAFISSSLMIAFSRLLGFTDIPLESGGQFPDPDQPSFFSPVPAQNLGALPPNIPANVSGESDELIAKDLPKKLSYPYLVVRSNIVINPDYIGGKFGYEKLPAIAYITRNYSSGDYFYSFTTNWNFTVDLPYILSKIVTDIRLPNGEPAPIDNNSSVIYKINKTQRLPDIQQLLTDAQKEETEQEKKLKPVVKTMPPSN